MDLPADHAERMARARVAIEGLSVGDAFGERFFRWPPEVVTSVLAGREMREAYWRYTDDTEMALGICEVLAAHGRIDQDALAATFARRYARDDRRGYGGMAHIILTRMGEGEPWQAVSRDAFDGTGSMGNGGAMRVAPVGAYFADDYARVADEAWSSAEVTHAHPEGQAGALAAALAAAWVWRNRGRTGRDAGREMIEFVAARTPEGRTRDGIELAAHLIDADVRTAARRLGSGERVTAPDTVPFCLWCAARNLGDFPGAIWETASVYGDVDTNCAIVGGIVVMGTGVEGIPAEWLAAREQLKFD